MENLKNEKEKINCELIDSENQIKKLKKENMLLKNSNNFIELKSENIERSEKIENINEKFTELISENVLSDKTQVIDENETNKQNNCFDLEFERKENLELEKISKLSKYFIHSPKVCYLIHDFFS